MVDIVDLKFIGEICVGLSFVLGTIWLNLLNK